MEQNELRVDLAAEKFNFSELSNLNEITSIRFDNYIDKIDIPLAINDYPNITGLYFSGSSGENLYQTPDNLEKFIHIKKLTLWSYCDFTKLKPMPHLETLHTVVQNTEEDTRNIVALFPDVKHLEIWGGHLKNQNLPDEIANLTALESLHLVSCGLENLPKSFVNLKKLKELNLRGLTMNTFPEVITQLENLEILEISQPLAKLPDELSNLKNLRKLNLNSALNGANMDVAGSFFNEKVYLKPIPEVIGKLKNLEDLNLAICGVFDITPILPLKKLKKLNLQYSALKNCDGFSNLKMLEELNLECSYALINLDGLTGLPLKKLSLNSNRNSSINIISSLEVLEDLNIVGCSYIKDYSPLYKSTSIKNLEADFQIIRNWENRNKYNSLPDVSLLIKPLDSEDISEFEQAVLHLSKHVQANYNDDNNPLADYFDVEIQEEEEIIFLQVLESGIQKHIQDLTDKSLVAIFEMTFKSVEYHNYNATLLVLQELISRKNVVSQKKIIKKFYKACEYYEPGHRYWGKTVYDQIIDVFFVQFTSEALYKLLKKAPTEMLHSQGGDGMDKLFIPAFKNTTDIKLQEKLLNVFLEYENEARSYYGKGYFDNLLQQINDAGSAELQDLILKKKEESKEQKGWKMVLENLNEDNFSVVIEQFISETSENSNEDDFSKITNAAKEIVLPESNLIALLNFMVKERDSNLPGVLMFQYHKKMPEKIIDFLKTQLDKNNLSDYAVTDIAKRIIKKLSETNTPLSELEIYENFLVSHCKMSLDQIYNIELDRFLDSFFYYLSWHWVDSSWTLEKAKEVALKIEGEINYTDLRSQTYILVDSGKYETAKEVFEILYPKTKYSEDEGALFYNIIAAVKLNDEEYFELLYKEVQKIEKISEVLLAYNLACAFAHFGRKENMLFYIKESIRLGKMKQQFLDDTDFEKYWTDADFLVAIEEK